jgi:hypothetical protein
MIDLGRFRQYRENILGRLREQICSVALKKDRVIPADGIVGTLTPMVSNRQAIVEIWDLPYDYTHENPFPVLKDKNSAEVDRSFADLISKAGLFLC